MLVQCAVDTKENEITALPDLLRQFCLTGQIVRTYAMGFQNALGHQILDGGDYVLALRANQEETFALVEDRFTVMECPKGQATTVEIENEDI